MAGRPRPRSAIDQVDAGRSFFATLGLEVGHFGALWHIMKIGQLMDADLNRIAGLHGLSIADFHMLGALQMARPNALRGSDLALAMNVSNAVLSVRGKRLASQGMLMRSSPADDRRAVLFAITEAGSATVDRIGADLERLGRFLQHFRSLPETDRVELERITRQLHARMERDFLPVVRADG